MISSIEISSTQKRHLLFLLSFFLTSAVGSLNPQAQLLFDRGVPESLHRTIARWVRLEWKKQEVPHEQSHILQLLQKKQPFHHILQFDIQVPHENLPRDLLLKLLQLQQWYLWLLHDVQNSYRVVNHFLVRISRRWQQLVLETSQCCQHGVANYFQACIDVPCRSPRNLSILTFRVLRDPKHDATTHGILVRLPATLLYEGVAIQWIRHPYLELALRSVKLHDGIWWCKSFFQAPTSEVHSENLDLSAPGKHLEWLQGPSNANLLVNQPLLSSHRMAHHPHAWAITLGSPFAVVWKYLEPKHIPNPTSVKTNTYFIIFLSISKLIFLQLLHECYGRIALPKRRSARIPIAY